MNRARILVHATSNTEVANLLGLAWSFARWCDADVDGYVVPGDPLATLRQRLGRPRAGDLVIAELPSDPSLATGMVMLLLQVGCLGMLLPTRSSPGDRLWRGWVPDGTATPANNAEAALCAIVMEQHLRWRSDVPGRRMGDPITSSAIEAVFNRRRPTWPTHRTRHPAWSPADRILLRTIGTGCTGIADAVGGCGMHGGWIVVPRRPALRMSQALDDGRIALDADDAALGTPTLVRAHISEEQVRFSLAGPVAGERPGTTFGLCGTSLLDPDLYQAWEALDGLLRMPRVRTDLRHARDRAGRRRILMLDDGSLAGFAAQEASVDGDAVAT